MLAFPQVLLPVSVTLRSSLGRSSECQALRGFSQGWLCHEAGWNNQVGQTEMMVRLPF